MIITQSHNWWFQCGVQNFRRRDQCFKCGGPKTDIDAGEGADEVSPHPTSSKCLKIVFIHVHIIRKVKFFSKNSILAGQVTQQV